MFFKKTSMIKELVGNHIEAVVTCYDKYDEAMQAVFNGCGMVELGTFTEGLRTLESQADNIRRQIIRQLLEGGLVVDSRKSIMHVIEAVDEVADMSEDIVQEIYIQQMHLPEMSHETLAEIIEVTRHQLMLLAGIVKSIVDKYDADEMTKVTQEIEELESKVDSLQQGLIKSLYESDLPLAEKMQFREIINMASHIADVIEDISDEVEIIMLARKV